MSSVDDRIVNMQFNNKQFESGVSQSQRSLQGLEQSISNTAKSKGLEGLASSVDNVKGHFSAMKIAGITAVATIAQKATSAGLNIIKSLTLDPLKQGFGEYQTNLNSIQTIMSNTGKGIKPVQAALDKLNHYADLTIYDFSQMARNIGTFSAAGVKLGPATSAIQGIANLAALSGSNADQASTAMYQLSQAIAAGSVKLQDWNSVVNAGMGGKQFQSALANTAVAMGKLDKSAVKVGDTVRVAGKSFRESIGGGKTWLDSKTLVATLETLDGRFSKTNLSLQKLKDGTLKYKNAQEVEMAIQKNRIALEKKGVKYTDAQFKQIQKRAEAAFNNATKVKTLPQLFGVVQEALGSIWSSFFTGLFGNFNQAVNMWTKLSNFINIGTGHISDGILGLTKAWAAADGRILAIAGIKNTFKGLASIISTIGSAFHDIFPPSGAKTIIGITAAFYAFSTYLKPSEAVLKDLRDIFGGVFAVLHIGVTIIKALAVGFGAFFGEVFKGSGKAGGGVLDFLAHMGQMLINVDKFLTSGGKMVDIFRNLGKAAGTVAGKGIEIASGIILGLIHGMSGSIGQVKASIYKIATQIVDWFKGALGIHSPARELVPVGTQIVAGIGQGILEAIKGIGKVIGKVVHSILGIFGDVLTNSDPFQWAGIMNTLFTGTLILSVWKFFHAFSGIGNAIRGTFNQLTNTLQSMQTKIKAEAIKQIAIAVGILALSIIGLSMVKPGKVAVAIGAIGALMGIMVASMKALGSIGKITDENGQSVQKGAGQLLALSAAMIGMATAVAILSAAVVLLGHQKPEVLAKGIGAVALMMALMVAAVQQVAKLGDDAKTAGGAMVLMATAMDVLSIAVFALGSMNIKTLAKGIGALAFMMGIMVGALLVLSKAGKGALQAAGAILIVSAAMTALAAVVFAFGQMDMTTLAKGFGAMGIALGLMVGSLLILSGEAPAVIVVAQAMALMSAAMIGLAIAVGMFGSMDTGTLAKGFIAVALGLGLLLLAAAAAIPLAPGLAILSEAFLALGGALALAGLGMLAFGTGFALMAAVGSAGVAVLVVAFQAFLAILPALGVQFAAAFVTFVQTIAAASDRLRPAFDKIFKNMIGVVSDNIPVLGHLIQVLITTAINIIKRSVPQWVEAGFTIIDKFIKSAAKHVPAMVDNALKLITGFMQAIARNLGPLADSAAKMIISFINAVSAAIDNNSEAMGKAGGKLGVSLVKGMVSGMKGMLSSVIGAAEDLAKGALGGIHKIFHNPPSPSREGMKLGSSLARGLALGISNATQEAVAAAIRMANAIIAVGDRSVAAVQARASVAQRNADAAQANADLAKQQASRVNAKKSPKLAKKLRKHADAAQNAADAAQAQADAAAQQVQDAKDFAAADNVGKGDIVSARAVDLAGAASKALARANAEAAQARKLRGKAAQQMLAQAKRDAAIAQSLADQAMAANRQANTYYAAEVQKRLDDIKAQDDAKKAQAEYDAADTAGKMDILQKRADSAQAQADAKYSQAAALVDQARGLAATDAAGALRLLDQADQLRSDAQTFADQAQQAKDQAAQLAGGGASGGGGGDSSSVIQASRSVLDNAASVVDSYTASLAAASEAAGATQTIVQYNQTNNSPVALTVSEVYRQSKNLLSAADIKVGTSPNN